MLLPPFLWASGTGVLLEPAEAESFAEAAQRGGLPCVRRAVDGFALFVYTPPPPAGTRVRADEIRTTASRNPKAAGLAADGKPGTRWATAGPRAPGDWFRIDLSAARSLRGIRLAAANPADQPAAVVLEGSPDGVRWERITAALHPEHRYRWAGIGILDDGIVALALDFPPVTVKALRLVLPAGDPQFDWSINELAVYGE
jgi:hypothetical protein